jgi:hypothetical protein
MEEAITRKAQGTGSHVAATAAIDTQIERGMNAVRQLDPVVRNIFAADVSAMAAWHSASHVERSPRRSAPPSPTPPAS